MHTRVINNRIVVDLWALRLPIGMEEIKALLHREGVNILDVDVVEIARELVGKARWKFGVFLHEMPCFLDCSALTKWVYGQKGIWLPRRSMQQYQYCQQYGQIIEGVDLIQPGDLVFMSSHYKYQRLTDSDEGIGHVCLAVDKDNIICATNSGLGNDVVEISLAKALELRKIRAIGRVFRPGAHLKTLELPGNWEVESADDIHWILDQILVAGAA